MPEAGLPRLALPYPPILKYTAQLGTTHLRMLTVKVKQCLVRIILVDYMNIGELSQYYSSLE